MLLASLSPQPGEGAFPEVLGLARQHLSYWSVSVLLALR